jgi:hypothetical protein
MRTIFQITPHIPEGYDISLGVGKIFHARNLQEVVYGLQHYFRESIPEYPFDSDKHYKHSKECDCCPLCRKVIK